LEELRVNGKIILKYILEKLDMKLCTGFEQVRYSEMVGSWKNVTNLGVLRKAHIFLVG
jgi:hypothetical protein